MNGNIKNLKIDEFLANETHYMRQLQDVENWRNIPILNYTPLCTIKNGFLMRFRGIIQDMLQNETYLSRYEIVNEVTNERRVVNGKFQDDILLQDNETVDLNGEQNAYCDRKLLYVTSVPGYNYWASEYETKINNNINNPPSNVDNVSRPKKRSLPDDSDEEEPKRRHTDTNEETIINKRVRSNNNDLNRAGPSPGSFHYYSTAKKLPTNEACIIKLYTEVNTYPLNTYVEAIGFVSFKDPNDKSKNNENQYIDPDMEFFEEAISKAFPGPELHTILLRAINSLNPTLDIGLAPVNSAFETRLGVIFDNLLTTLTQCLFGDRTAAQYLIGHIISTIYVRTEAQTLGQFSINLFNLPNDQICAGYTKSLYELLQMLLPASSYLLITLENLNTVPIVPKKDYRISKLITGALQLADQTQLVLDETELKSGNLDQNGVIAVHHLSDLIVRQNIYYDFDYYKISFITNIPTLILSEGRSMLPTNCHIPVMYDVETIPVILETLKAAKHYIQSKLYEIRQYLTNCTKTDFVIMYEVTRLIEDDFVQLRKTDESIGSEYLHTLLVLSRLMGIATGKYSLQKETWQMAKNMEFERRLRLSPIRIDE